MSQYGHERSVATGCFMAMNNRSGLAMLHKPAGVNPAQVTASHEPDLIIVTVIVDATLLQSSVLFGGILREVAGWLKIPFEDR